MGKKSNQLVAFSELIACLNVLTSKPGKLAQEGKLPGQNVG